MTNAQQIKKFMQLAADKKQAGLDLNIVTGEILCMATKNQTTGAVGNGAPGQTFGEEWERVASCAEGIAKSTSWQTEKIEITEQGFLSWAEA